MHALIELIASLIAALAAAAFAQFGIELQPRNEAPEEREVRRTVSGQASDAPQAVRVKSPSENC